MKVIIPRPMGYDWVRLLDEIAYLLGDRDLVRPDLRTPCSKQQLADALDAPLGTLRGWLDGARPKHEDGEQILESWCSVTGKHRIYAHRTRRSLTATER